MSTTVTATPVTLDSGSSFRVLVTNVGAADVFLSAGGVRLRPGQVRDIYPEGKALTAYTASGQTSSVNLAVTASNPQGAGGGGGGALGPNTVGTSEIIDGSVGLADLASAVTSALAAKADGAATTTALAGKAPSSGIAPSAITGTAVVTADSRLSDARTPTAHASTHATGGGDAVTLTQAQVTGLASALAAKLDSATATATFSPLSEVARATAAEAALANGTNLYLAATYR